MTQHFAPENFNRLQQLAQLSGVSTTFWDWHGNLREVSAQTLISTLQALGVDLSDAPGAEELDARIRGVEDDKWMSVLPATTIQREGDWTELHVHVPDGESVTVTAIFEDGSEHNLTQIDNWDPARNVDGNLRGRAAFALEQWFPLGYHHLVARLGNGEVVKAHYIVVPQALDVDSKLPGQKWGVASQLYSVRSKDCWGMGDTEVLASLNRTFGQIGADFHQINPLHAAAPTVPVEPSPYLPVTRQFISPIYIYPESIPEYDALTQITKTHVAELNKAARVEDSDDMGLVDRDKTWEAKIEALWEIFRIGRSAQRDAELDAFIEEGGEALRKFAIWSALVEQFGLMLPVQYADSSSEEVARFADENDKRVRFHMWMQWVVAGQLDDAQTAAHEAGMDIGIMSDLAVGVHPHGSETWTSPEMFAPNTTVGAPPDMYSQLGQDWSQPPWNPRALAEVGYMPLRRMIRAAARFSGAIRIDHILGLFRLWWIPAGKTANFGTYVNYDHEAMVGILLLEAKRNGSIVIGEDLGTVEPWVRGYLNDRGVLGTSILWFEREQDGSPLRPEHYRRDVLAAVNTHDLPPTAGYLDGIQTTIRNELGLLVEPIEVVRESDRQELEAFTARMIEYGLLDPEHRYEEQPLIDALYRYIAQAPSRLLSVSLVDIVRERRPQNFPGTHAQYPNWKIPLGDEDGREVTLDRLTPESMARFANVMNEVVTTPGI
ncbi:MAG: 4-alpha-glucanotransferase [Actinomycetaceae bacterium]|nr:4-alpha-glucanotransferase [Actinomycetaceae bacterium]